MTDTRRESAKRGPADKHLWKVACDLLNGDAPIPTKRRAAPKREPGLMTMALLRQQYDVVSAAQTDPARQVAKRLRLQDIGLDDVKRLRWLLDTYLRYQAAPSDRKPSDAARPPWPPNPSSDEWNATCHELLPRLRSFKGAIDAMERGFGTDHTRRFLSGLLLAAPQTLEDACLCLLTAFLLHRYPRARIVPCLACNRFFVASRSNAKVCSFRCNQRLCRANQDPEAVKKRNVQYKRDQRVRERKAREQEETAQRLHRKSIEIRNHVLSHGENIRRWPDEAQRRRGIAKYLSDPVGAQGLAQVLTEYHYAPDEIEAGIRLLREGDAPKSKFRKSIRDESEA